jgi:hypothetical protein
MLFANNINHGNFLHGCTLIAFLELGLNLSGSHRDRNLEESNTSFRVLTVSAESFAAYQKNKNLSLGIKALKKTEIISK